MIAWKFRRFSHRKTGRRQSGSFPRSATSNGLACRCVVVLLAMIVLAVNSAMGQIATDVSVSKDATGASTTITTPSFSTVQANELLLAFVTTDYVSGTNTTVTSLSGGGLTWTLVQRANGQSGSAEIWRALTSAPLSNVTVTASLSQNVVSSMTVMSFTGVNISGTNGSGAIGA